ncbi:MAG: hypothetical protein R3B67_04320 [Phycisphaerales bacterium]
MRATTHRGRASAPARDADSHFVVGWGTEVNQYEHASVGTIDLNIYLSHSKTTAKHTPLVKLDEVDVVAEPNKGAFESQLRLSPSGTRMSRCLAGD